MMKLDYIRIGLIVGNIVFIILSVVFIILFATKHDSSSAFLVSSQIASNDTADSFKQALTKSLQKKYSVGTIATEKSGSTGNAVFSLRGSPNIKDVGALITGNSAFSNVQITDGAKSMEVCNSKLPVGSTLPPATVLTSKANPSSPAGPGSSPIPSSPAGPGSSPIPSSPAAPSSSPSGNTNPTSPASNKPPASTAASVTTPTPPVSNKYCQGSLKRDIILLVDTLAPTGNQDKNAALTGLGQRLANGIPFGTGTRVALMTLERGEQIGGFATDVATFQDNWKTLSTLSFNNTASSIDVSIAYGMLSQLLQPLNPVEVILVTEHSLDAIAPTADIRLRGVFVAAVVPTKITLPGIDQLTTVTKSYGSWADMTTQNPFSTLFCQYNDGTASTMTTRFASKAVVANNGDTPKCQKLDIIVVFDTSQSVVEPFVQKYVNFSIDFISQYTLMGAVDGDNTRTGIISFNSDVNVVRELGERSLDDFKAAVSGIHFTGGVTNTLGAMKAGLAMFQRHSDTTHGRTMVFLSDGQPYPPSPDTWSEILSVGEQLRAMGVDIFFVGDANGYDPETRTILSNITGNPDWVFDNVGVASVNLTVDLLMQFPCPPLICEMAYYAVEISEILSEQTKIATLNFTLQVAQNVYNQKNSTQFQLLIYNDKQYFLPNDGDYSFANFKSNIDRLINDNAYRSSLSSGHTRIDTAINALADQMTIQQKRRPYFQSSVLFAGQANSGVLDPIGDEIQQQNDLAQAAQNIKAVCPLIYALDDSNGNTALYGDDLWYIVVPKTRTIRLTSLNLEKDLENTDYYPKVYALDCVLPARARCDLNFIDLGVAFDLTGPLTSNVTDYVKSLLAQFDTQYTAHISMYGFGGGKDAKIFASLSSHDNMDSFFYSLTNWELGLTTTAAPTTVQATTSKGNQKEEFSEIDDVIPITTGDINSLFSLIKSQFGCGHYSSNGDRILVSNVILVVSDNFASYQNIWQQFADDSQNGWTCDDCPGTPAYAFLSSTADKAPIGLGLTYNINDDEYYDLSYSMKAVNLFNSIVTGVCTMPLKSCWSYTVPTTCQQKSNEFWEIN